MGDGSTTFNLPDLRGRFIRSWSDGSSIDSGRTFGSNQSDAIRDITGTLTNSGGGHGYMPGGTGAFSATYTGSQYIQSGNQGNLATITFKASNVVSTAADNRPYNTALLACIKY